MSDVWQGPGWWLASDGKWYPADAQPGGGADQPDTTTETTAAAPADPAATVVAEPIVAEPAPAPTPEPIPTPAPAPEIAAEPAPKPVIPSEPAPAPVAEPAPIVEPSRGGWQAVQPEADVPAADAGEWTEPAVAAADTPSIDDGWSSAYETAQVAEIVDVPTPTEPPAPTFTVPDVAPPVAATPLVDIPDVTPPTPTAPPVEVPNVAAPVASTPIVDIPEVASPTAVAPEITGQIPVVPDVPAPVATPPETTGQIPVVPDVQAPAATEAVPTVPLDADRRSTPEPLARDDAWRKPGDTSPEPVVAGAAAAAAGVRPAPGVVDLAIPTESPLNPAWTPPTKQRNPVRGIVTGVLVLLTIVALGLLIGWFFTRDSGTDSTVTDADTTTSSVPTTDASAPSTSEDTETTDTAAEPANGSEVSVFELRAGDCIQGQIGSGQVQRLIKVDCSIPHEFEVYREALIDSSVTSFDEAAISAQAEEVCRTSLAAYIPPTDERDLKFKWFQPTEESWNQATDPDRVITCLLFDEEGPLTGRAA